MWQYIRQTLEQARKAKSWSRTQLDDRLGVAHGTSGRWEAGRREVPADKLGPLSEVLGLELPRIWEAPITHFPKENRRPLLPPYAIKGSHADFPRLGYSRPQLSPLVTAEMEAAYPRDTEHELVAAYKVLGDGALLVFTTLDALECPYLVAVGFRDYQNGLRHLRHALLWKGMVLVPQVTLAAVTQARMPRVDWLVHHNSQWCYVELNGGRHDPELDEVRVGGIGLREVRYSNQTILKPQFIHWLHADLVRLFSQTAAPK